MYDSEYFRKVIGDNYNPNDLYSNTTYNNSTSAKIYEVDSKSAEVNTSQNVNNVLTMANNNENMNNTFAVANMNPNVSTANNQPTLNNIPNQAQYLNNTSPFEAYNVNAKPVSSVTYNEKKEQTPQIAYNVNTTQTSQIRYPEIYNVLNPMVDKVLETNKNIEYNEATINTMSTEIYNALEVDSSTPKATNVASTFNSAIQVNAKPKNYLLHDLIKIMLIDKVNSKM